MRRSEWRGRKSCCKEAPQVIMCRKWRCLVVKPLSSCREGFYTDKRPSKKMMGGLPSAALSQLPTAFPASVLALALFAFAAVATRAGQGGDSSVRTLQSHAGSVLGVEFSPDGKLLVSCSRDKTIKFWDPRTGTLLRTLTEHTGDVYDAVFSPKGDLLASGGRDKVIRLWDPH